MEVRPGDIHAAYQASALVGRYLRLADMLGLTTPMPDPMCFAIVGDVGRYSSGHASNCSVHQGAGAHHDPLGLELVGDGLEQHAVQATVDQLPAEPDEGRPLVRWLVGSETAELTEAGAIV